MIEILITYRFVAMAITINGSFEFAHFSGPSHLITLRCLILNEGATTTYYETDSIN